MNRQVPIKYTIIGDGKVARHFACYFDLLKIKYHRWNRKQSTTLLQQSIESTGTVLLLISDNAIEAFIKQHTCLKNKTLIHFSGALTTDLAIGCHPLMTFAEDLYALETYRSIPFVCDNGSDFIQLFPRLENKAFYLSQKDKAYYHALCVIAGNFTQSLMRESHKNISTDLDLPADILFPYLLQNTKNFIANPDSSATGPIERGDFSTINKHLSVLEGNSLENIYKSFLKYSNTIRHPHKCENDKNYFKVSQ